MGASNYTRNNVLNAILRGVTLPLPTGTYISLHTADPGVNGANEVGTGAWPAYVRRKAEGAGAIGTGWTAAASGVSSNTNQLTFPAMDGGSPVTATHFAVWDAASAGNCIGSGQLSIARVLGAGDIYVADIGALVAQLT